ncbi:MAG: hypothetical protein AAB456_00875, partial [Patescibacteria group bacterium]
MKKYILFFGTLLATHMLHSVTVNDITVVGKVITNEMHVSTVGKVASIWFIDGTSQTTGSSNDSGDPFGNPISTRPGTFPRGMEISSGTVYSTWNVYGLIQSTTGGLLGATTVQDVFTLSGGSISIANTGVPSFTLTFASGGYVVGDRLIISQISGNRAVVASGKPSVEISQGGGGGGALYIEPADVSISTLFLSPTDFILGNGTGISTATVKNSSGPWSASQVFFSSTIFNNSVLVSGSSITVLNGAISIGTTLPLGLLTLSTANGNPFYIVLTSDTLPVFTVNTSSMMSQIPLFVNEQSTFIGGTTIGGKNFATAKMRVSDAGRIVSLGDTTNPIDLSAGNFWFYVNGEMDIRNARTGTDNQITLQTDATRGAHINFRPRGVLKMVLIEHGKLVVNLSTGINPAARMEVAGLIVSHSSIAAYSGFTSTGGALLGGATVQGRLVVEQGSIFTGNLQVQSGSSIAVMGGGGIDASSYTSRGRHIIQSTWSATNYSGFVLAVATGSIAPATTLTFTASQFQFSTLGIPVCGNMKGAAAPTLPIYIEDASITDT